jgi:hypothetical protein
VRLRRLRLAGSRWANGTAGSAAAIAAAEHLAKQTGIGLVRLRHEVLGNLTACTSTSTRAGRKLRGRATGTDCLPQHRP